MSKSKKRLTDSQVEEVLASMPHGSGVRPTKSEYVIGVKGSETQVGIVTDDGRCRMDTHSGLDGWTFYEAEWKDPKNPWLGGRTTDVQVHGLEPDWT